MVTTDEAVHRFDQYARRILRELEGGPFIRVALRVIDPNGQESRIVLRQCAASDCPNGFNDPHDPEPAWFNAYTGEGRDRLYCTARCRRRTTQRAYRAKAKGLTTHGEHTEG